MSDAPLVSIVIPVYNGAKYLGQALDSALNQTYSNVEVVVVNDGSTDKTDELCRKYGDQIRYFRKENGGVATALNLALQNITGEYFSWLSHDDEYLPDKISRQMAFIQERRLPADAVIYGDYYFIDSASALTGVTLLPRRRGPQHFLPLLYGEINGCTLLVPRRCLVEAGEFAPELRSTQDYDMWARIASNHPFYHQPLALVRFRVHEEQGSRIMGSHKKEAGEFVIRLLRNTTAAQFEEMQTADPAFMARALIFAEELGYENAAAYLATVVPRDAIYERSQRFDRSWRREISFGGFVNAPGYSLEMLVKKGFIQLKRRLRGQ